MNQVRHPNLKTSRQSLTQLLACGLILSALLSSQTVAAQGAVAPKPSQSVSSSKSSSMSSYLYRAQVGDTAETIAFEYLDGARDKANRERFYALNKIAAKSLQMPLREGQPLNIPVAWMYLKPVLASVLSATGSIQMSHSNTSGKFIQIDAKVTAIEEGTSIKTADNSFVKIKFPDHSVLTVAPNSEALIESLKRYANSDIFKIQVLLNKGRVESEVKPFTHSASDYTVRSKRLTTGVRGTVFNVGDNPNGNAIAEVLEGGVLLTDGSARAFTVPIGFGSVVKQTQASGLIALLPAPVWQCDTTRSTELGKRLPLQASPLAKHIRFDIHLGKQASLQGLNPAFQRLSSDASLPLDLPAGDYTVEAKGEDSEGLQGYGSTQQLQIKQVNTPITQEWVLDTATQSWTLETNAATSSTQVFCVSNSAR